MMKRQRKFKFLGTKGFTLVEVMVAAGLLGVLSVAVTQIMSNINRGTKKVRQDFEANSFKNRLATLMLSEDNCTETLGGLAVDAAPGTPVLAGIKKVGAVNPTFNIDDQIGNAGEALTIRDIRIFGYCNDTNPATYTNHTCGADGVSFDTFSYVDGNGVPQTRRRGEISLVVNLRKSGRTGALTAEQQDAIQKSSFGALEMRTSIKLNVVTTTAGVIEKCFGDRLDYAQATCVSMGGTFFEDDGTCRNFVMKNRNTLPSAAFDAPANAQQYSLNIDGPTRFYGTKYDDAAAIANTGGVVISVNAGSMAQPTDAGSLWVEKNLHLGAATTDNPTINITGAVSADLNYLAPATNINTNGTINETFGGSKTTNITGDDLNTVTGNISNDAAGFITNESGGKNTITSSAGEVEVNAAGVVDVNGSAGMTVDITGEINTNASTDINTNASANINTTSAGTHTLTGQNVNINGVNTVRLQRDGVNAAYLDAGGHLISNFTYSQIGDYGANNSRFVTKEWVYRTLATSFGADERKAILQHLLNDAGTAQDKYTSIRDAILAYRSFGTVTTGSGYTLCGSGQVVRGAKTIGTQISLYCVNDSNDKCNYSNSCTSVCIGSVCKSSWPVPSVVSCANSGLDFQYIHTNVNPSNSTAGTAVEAYYQCPSTKPIVKGFYRQRIYLASGNHAYRTRFICCGLQ